jgi:endonuclease/exonuclease/phosphatase family metal-dependent hydrolase
VGSLNVHSFSSKVEELAAAVEEVGPFDILAIQESSPFSAGKLATFCHLIGMKVAVICRADFGLHNAICIPQDLTGSCFHHLDKTVHKWELQSQSPELRSAVAVVVTVRSSVTSNPTDADGGGGGGGGGGGVAATSNAMDGDAAAAADDDGGEGARITFVCTHLDAYKEQHRLEQLHQLQLQLHAAIGGGNQPPLEYVEKAVGYEKGAAPEEGYGKGAVPTEGVIMGGGEAAATATPRVPARSPAPAPAPAPTGNVPGWLATTPFFLLGDFNALREADYTPTRWLWLTGTALFSP